MVPFQVDDRVTPATCYLRNQTPWDAALPQGSWAGVPTYTTLRGLQPLVPSPLKGYCPLPGPFLAPPQAPEMGREHSLARRCRPRSWARWGWRWVCSAPTSIEVSISERQSLNDARFHLET